MASKAMLRHAPEQARSLPCEELLRRLEGLEGDLASSGKVAMRGFEEAVEGLAAYLEEYRKSWARCEPGVGSMEGGAEIYAQCLAYHTTTSMLPEEIHAIGSAQHGVSEDKSSECTAASIQKMCGSEFRVEGRK